MARDKKKNKTGKSVALLCGPTGRKSTEMDFQSESYISKQMATFKVGALLSFQGWIGGKDVNITRQNFYP